MRDLNIKRLIVVDKDKLYGVISSDDIVKITPELITIISQESIIDKIHSTSKSKKKYFTGICESCDQWSNSLRESDGLFLCEGSG